MTLVRFNPFREMMRTNYMDRFFDDFWNVESDTVWTPSVDIAENEDAYEFSVEIPGMKKDEINISYKNGVLTLTGEKKKEEKKESKNVYRTERVYGKFQRSFRIPDEVDADKIKAEYSDGILTVTVPKSEVTKPKQIAIK